MFTLRESRRGDHELCKLGSNRHETSAKRVSEDLQLSIFSRRKKFFEKIFNFFFKFFPVFRNFRRILEELGFFGRQNRVPGGILLLMGGFSGPYEAWRPLPSNSDPKKTQRAGPSYARFLLFLEAWILSGLKDLLL